MERFRKCQSEALEQHGAITIRNPRITGGDNGLMIRIRGCGAIQFDLMLSKVSHAPTRLFQIAEIGETIGNALQFFLRIGIVGL